MECLVNIQIVPHLHRWPRNGLKPSHRGSNFRRCVGDMWFDLIEVGSLDLSKADNTAWMPGSLRLRLLGYSMPCQLHLFRCHRQPSSLQRKPEMFLLEMNIAHWVHHRIIAQVFTSAWTQIEVRDSTRCDSALLYRFSQIFREGIECSLNRWHSSVNVQRSNGGYCKVSHGHIGQRMGEQNMALIQLSKMCWIAYLWPPSRRLMLTCWNKSTCPPGDQFGNQI